MTVSPALATPDSSRWSLGEIILALVCVTVFTVLYLRNTIEYDRATLAALVDGTAWKPFVMRILTPSLIRVARDLAGVPLSWSAALIAWVAALWCWVAFRSWAFRLWPAGRAARLAPLALLFALLANLVVCTRHAYGYPYDLPATAFFLSGLLAIREGRLGLFYGLFLGGLLNRESIFLLIPAFVLLRYDRDPAPRVALHALVLSFLGMAVKLALSEWFRGNSGGLFENHLEGNLEIFRDAVSGGHFVDLVSSLACCGFLWAVAPLDWRGQPAEVRRLFLLWIPFLAIHFVASNLYELRIYGELAPIVAIGAIHPLLQVIAEVRMRLKRPAGV